jgi:ABC-type Mn2+/Zn2+ transport system ATPase subunit
MTERRRMIWSGLIRGETVAGIGPNGVGKITLMRVISDMVAPPRRWAILVPYRGRISAESLVSYGLLATPRRDIDYR